MQIQNFIVINPKGANVRAQMDTTNSKNLLRWMSPDEGFVVYETYTVKGSSGLQTWGRISNNPGGKLQEYVCLQIGNTIYAKQEKPTTPALSSAWAEEIDAWARSHGYTGIRP